MITTRVDMLKNGKCPFCKRRTLVCINCRYGMDDSRPVGLIPPSLFFSREYRCYNCRAVLNLYTIVDTLNIEELFRKDKIWLESLK